LILPVRPLVAELSPESGSGVEAAPDKLAVRAIAFAIALMPLLRPKGPGHTAPADVAIAAAVVMALLWASKQQLRVHLPYLVPVGVLVLAGLTSALFSSAPFRGVLAVTQELFLLAWCAAVANVSRAPRALAAILRAWSWAALAWATVLVAAVATGQRGLAGVENVNGGRAQLMFDHPNLAANYFVVSLFVVVLARCPRHPVARAVAVAVIGLATILAGSNAALLGLPLAAFTAAVVALWRRFDPAVAIATLLIGGVLAAAAISQVNWQGIVTGLRGSDNVLIRSSVARSSRSANARQELFASQVGLFRTGSVVGRGPASTRHELGSESEARVKEAHNDYLATLVERGPLGVIGLVLLFGGIAVRVAGASPRGFTDGFARVCPGTAPLVAVFVLLAASAITHEVLHYRHLWALLGILAALHLFGRRQPEHLEGTP
jgi:O-antigen ligase